MAFDIDPDKPDVPAIARILSGLGLVLLIGTVIFILLAFSGSQIVNADYCFLAAIGSFFLAVVLIGQAKTLELLALVSARVKSRFALERAVIPQQQAQPPQAAVAQPASAPQMTAQKERVISIPESVAREQGLSPIARKPRDFG